MNERRADELYLKGRKILAWMPAMLVVSFLAYITVKDLFWSWKLVTHPWVGLFIQFLTEGAYRDYWLGRYAGLVITFVVLVLIAGYILKTGVWDYSFKILVVRTQAEDMKHVRPVGRCYWIEKHGGYGITHKVTMTVANALRKLRIVDIHIVPLMLKPRQEKEKAQQPPVRYSRPRVIYYKPTVFPLRPLAPWRAMHRIRANITDDDIRVHDPRTIMITGFRLERDLKESYPTFNLTDRAEAQVSISIEHYRAGFDELMERASLSTEVASQMDSFILKEQRKFQEVLVPVDRELYEKFHKEKAIEK